MTPKNATRCRNGEFHNASILSTGAINRVERPSLAGLGSPSGDGENPAFLLVASIFF